MSYVNVIMFNAVIPDSGYNKDENNKPVKKGLGFGDFIDHMKTLKEDE